MRRTRTQVLAVVAALAADSIAPPQASGDEKWVRVMRHDNKFSVLFSSQEAKNETISRKSLGPWLPLAQQIVVAHGGSIAAKARHPHCTTFEIWLPASAQANSRSPVRRVG